MTDSCCTAKRDRVYLRFPRRVRWQLLQPSIRPHGRFSFSFALHANPEHRQPVSAVVTTKLDRLPRLALVAPFELRRIDLILDDRAIDLDRRTFSRFYFDDL